MGDLDFAHGIPPERYRCKRPKKTGSSCARSSARSTQTCLGNANRQAIHWSLDQGKWIYHEPKPDCSLVEAGARRECNPFIRFKNLVDRGFGALNLMQRQRELYQLRREQEEDAWHRWTGEPYENKSRIPLDSPRTDAVKAARYILETADLLIRYEAPLAQSKYRDLFQDDQNTTENAELRPNPMLGLGAWLMCPEVADSLPSTRGLFRPPPPPAPRWLSIDWFKRSPYSPIQIEAVRSLPGPRERWRNAFEDLVLTTLERDHDREPLTRATRRQSDPLREPGIDWVISLQERAILPPILPSLHYGSHTGWSRAAYLGNIEHFDYKEFSNLVDEIWLSNRSFLHRFWYDNLLATRKELIPQLELPFGQG